MSGRIFSKLIAAFLLVIVVATLALDIGVRRARENSLYNEIKTGLEQKVRAFALQVEHESSRPTSEVAADFGTAVDARATVIDSRGRVLADTRANPGEMENHATRPEFIAALHGQIGSATRTSHTVGIPFLYVAAPIKGGAVRLAYPLSSIQQMTREVRLHLLAASGIALVIAAILAAVVAQMVLRRLKRIVAFARRVAAGDLSARIEDRSADEVAQVATVLDRTARKLEESFAALETSRRQLETVLNSMPDPVFVVSADRRIHWANAPIGRIARAPTAAPLVSVFRDPNLLAAIESALQSGAMQRSRAAVAGHSYEVISGPMPGGGAVTVLHDISEVGRVEKTRRDFIANVSHELHTPLTSIHGYTRKRCSIPGPGARIRKPRASSWRSSARTPAAWHASPKTCWCWREWNRASSASRCGPCPPPSWWKMPWRRFARALRLRASNCWCSRHPTPRCWPIATPSTRSSAT